MSWDIMWEECKTKDPEETMKMLLNQNEDDIVPGIKEDKTSISHPEDQLHMHVIPDEG